LKKNTFTQGAPGSQFMCAPYSIYCTFSFGRGGGGQREDRGATVHKYSSFVQGGNSSQAG
jgi:hypothetical protein